MGRFQLNGVFFERFFESILHNCGLREIVKEGESLLAATEPRHGRTRGRAMGTGGIGGGGGL